MTARQVQAEETRQRILDQAVRLFTEGRYDDVAVSDIAVAADVAHGLLFHYFKNKRGLYVAAMEAAASEIDLAQADGLDNGIPVGVQMRQVYKNHFLFLARHKGLAMRLVLGGRGADPEAWKVFEESRWRSVEWGCKLLGLDPQSPALRMMLRSTIAAVDETAAFWHQTGQVFDVEVLSEVMFEQTIASLRGAAVLDPDSAEQIELAITALRAD